VLLEVQAQVEDGLPEHARVTEQKGDEQSSKPSVPVEERVDRLELNMRERGLDEDG